MPRRVRQSFQSLGIKALDDITSFPFSALFDDEKFRYFVDQTNGADSNDGRSWATAFKTSSKVVSVLPNDLNGFEAWIFFSPGTYDGMLDFSTFINGTIIFNHVTKHQYENIGGYSDKQKEAFGIVEDGVCPFGNQTGPVIFKNSSGTKVLNLDCIENSNFTFKLHNFTWKSWNDDDNAAPEVLQVHGNDSGAGEPTTDPLILLKNSSFFIDQNKPKFSLANANIGFLLSGGATLYYYSANVTGGSGNASTNDSHPYGFIVCNAGKNVISSSAWKAYNYIDQSNGSVLSNQNRHSISGIRRYIYSFTSVDYKLSDLDATSYIEYSQGDLGDTDKPKIVTDELDTGTISIDTSLFQLENISEKAISITIDGSTKIQASKGLILDSSGNMIFDAANSSAADGNLNNGNLSFSLDESGDNLNIKVKYSNGTVKTATVALT